MKKEYWMAGSAAAVLLIAVLFLFFRAHEQRTAVATGVGISDKTVKAVPPAVSTKKTKSTSQKIPPVSYHTSGTDKAGENDYPDEFEMEKEFIEEARETIPDLIEVEVHEPGVIFYRHKPAPPDIMAQDMRELAELYRDRLGYDKPVNVVFFISGRPVRAKVFFRD